MHTNVRVKMEYPFPSNQNAFLVNEWLKAAEFETNEDLEMTDDGEIVSSPSVCESVECMKNAILAMKQQKMSVDEAIEKFEQYGDDVHEQVIIDGWKLIKEVSNYIRCVSSHMGVNGEAFGLMVLFDALSEEEG